ncbi:AAA family ATPase [Prevotella multiformis]|uniref:UvrD-helicase domain-containing protein n=1 Tax=Prevotella multiformis TaxID=282402 RepID=UPI001BA471AB|nr:UvrD-helicase domain-containing protein [Prevotella multiformis]QUB71740.1 AAA family ATPase [Prevotella multiformis]
MIDWKEFIDCFRGVLIAPAGHGKTTAIADCLLQCPEDSCQLVLTHTHAGIASLRTKFQKKNVPASRYHLETITGFAQRYVLNFFGKSVLPSEENKNYFEVAVEKCKELIQSSIVQNILKLSYNGVFVDEYQDCTIDQHLMVLELAHDLPLHLLGDPLQGIFSFERKRLVDFTHDLSFFQHFNLLNHPWRWEETNPALGCLIFEMRKKLETGECIELQNNPAIGFYVMPCTEQNKYSVLANIIKYHNTDNMLIICPSYTAKNRHGQDVLKGDVKDRIGIKQRADFNNQFSILDAIDGKEYYACARQIDEYISKCKRGRRIHKVARLYNILSLLHFKMSIVQDWINPKDNRFVDRQKDNTENSQKLKALFLSFESTPSLQNLQQIISFVSNLPKVKNYHRVFLYTINKCFDVSIINNISMFEAMKLLKTRVRHQGRKIHGKYIGTTLLTKGLEFDSVVIWEADKFEDAKNFYVAISRACKKLIVITEKTTLNLT